VFENLIVEPPGQVGGQVVLLGDGRDVVQELLLPVFVLHRLAILGFRFAEFVDDCVALGKKLDNTLVDLVDAGTGFI